MRRVNVLSLFSGIGGLDLGLEWAGMTTVGQVEIDPFARTVLSRHWPEVPKHDNVKTAVDWWLNRKRPRVDVVAGGYPCQPESAAGKRGGAGDARWLWPEMARVIAAVRPRYVVGENVMGHRTQGLRFVLRDLEDLGYTTRAGIVAASEMGAPHRRQRVFTLGELSDSKRGHVRNQPGRGGRTNGTSPGLTGHDGASQHVADTKREPRIPRRSGDTEQGARGRDVGRGGIGPDVPHTGGPGRGARRRERGVEDGQPSGVTGGGGG